MVAFEKSILVVAHPDDEALWFSSLMDKVSEVVVCYSNVKSEPSLSEGRKISLTHHPLKSISCLMLDEAEVFNDKNWHAPITTQYGIEIKADKWKKKQYEKNYFILKEYLYPRLKTHQHIFTHNPWGEYGHEEHVQLYRVIKSLQKDLGSTIWYPNYVSNKSLPLMQKTISSLSMEYFSMTTQSDFGASLKRLYERNSCWTWYKNWQWCRDEAFLRENTKDNHPVENQPVPLNFIRVDISPQTRRKKRPSFLKRVIKHVN